MSITANSFKVREVINQVVNDPHYKEVSSVPLWSAHQIIIIALAYIVPIALIGAHIQFGLPLWIIYPIMAVFMYTAFTPLHDCTHRAISSNNTINDVLGTIAGQVLFPLVTAHAYRYLHLAHHRYVGDKGLDPDEKMVSIPTQYFPFGYLFLFVPETYWVYWAIKERRRIPNVTRWHIAFTFLMNPVFHVMMFLSPIGMEYLMYFFIPSRLAIWITAYAFAHSPHPEGLKWNDHPFLTTYKLKSKRLIIDGLLGQEHHAMHHFLPHVPWYKYFKVWNLANGAFQKQFIPEKVLFRKPDKEAGEKIIQNLKEEKEQFKVRITQKEQLTPEIVSLTFEGSEDELPNFDAGSHIDLYLPSGKVRSYSLVNAPFEKGKYQIAVKKEVEGRGGSSEVHESLSVGDELTISAPKNNFVLYENVNRYILISGGIGITPLISMSHRLSELEKHFELHVCARTKEAVPFAYQLENWTFAPNVELHLDQNGKSSIELSSVLADAKKDALIYVCGPGGFNNWVKKEALAMGWNKDQIKSEAFHADISQVGSARPFNLKLLKSNKTIHVDEDLSILDALQLNNIDAPYSCLQGTCGVCVREVVHGEIEHRDAYLSEEEKVAHKKICICVSRAKGESLSLDL